MKNVLLVMVTLLPFLSYAQTLKNSGSPATVVELFTSEGCSSCPPAEHALNQLKHADELWKTVIPLAFHVDYWNYIGWEDRFASPQYSQRQRDKVSLGQASGVYTPGWFINDQEWRGFFSRHAVPYAQGPKAPTLEAEINQTTLRVHYDGNQLVRANMALLAMDLETQVKRGENRGRTLEHDFVVVDFSTKIGRQSWTFPLSQHTTAPASAIAVWLSPIDGGDPIQTVAGWIEK
ncbi:DUF1223 domain-containing protein [Enterovibrio sp. ZSDZ35]|uniref:DUF1223 domain-containing protein n=1 Tax=Enterovibrio qingdaonensis TaxID=2899818 RepID=A0ABT5QRQ0_9GAMM|nr:DUF1223 domain-containing protein [Enterovibrio sp. ZSDZ35]MDD1783666.1 DUF1223 domain-containing protein [Enterovibrio sp. ZSDZ35]